MRKPHIFAILAVVVILMFAVSAALAQPQEPYPLGKITLSAKQVAAGVGFTWGSGTLKFQGKTYHFAVKGLDVAAVGFAKVSARGDVYNLKHPSDLAGKYAAAQAGAALIKGRTGLMMRNEKGVVINLLSDQTGAQLTLGASGVSITMK